MVFVWNSGNISLNPDANQHCHCQVQDLKVIAAAAGTFSICCSQFIKYSQLRTFKILIRPETEIPRNSYSCRPDFNFLAAFATFFQRSFSTQLAL